jgi:hypothetical protein
MAPTIMDVYYSTFNRPATMKTTAFKKYILTAIVTLVVFITIMSCEQTSVEPELAAAPGGGTLSAYKAYTLEPTGGDNIYGRVVFWKDNANNTLVQVSLYNTGKGASYPVGLYEGSADGGSVTELMSLYSVDGTTGEFGTSKFYVIGDKDFYSALNTLDAHIRIMTGSTLIAAGNVGSNSKPVATEGN